MRFDDPRLVDARDRDGFFVAPAFQAYLWSDDRRESWRVEFCPWNPHRWLEILGEWTYKRLMILRWEIAQGRVTERMGNDGRIESHR